MSRRSEKMWRKGFSSAEAFAGAPDWMTGEAAKDKVTVTWICARCSQPSKPVVLGVLARFTNHYDENRGLFWDGHRVLEEHFEGSFKVVFRCPKCKRRFEEASERAAERVSEVWSPSARTEVVVSL